MKQLISQSRKLLTYNTPLLLCLTLFLSTSSCEMVDSKNLSYDFPSRQVNLALSFQSGMLLMKAQSCAEELREYSFSLYSPYGVHKVKISDPKDGEFKGSTIIFFDEQRFLLKDWQFLNEEEKKAICKQSESKDQAIAVAPETVEHLLSKLRDLVPTCQLSFHENHLLCSSPKLDQPKISDLESKLFRAKPRHPYVLARRIAMTRKLMQANSPKYPLEAKDLCRIASLSGKDELPLPMRSKVWLSKCEKEEHKGKDTFIQATISESIKEANYLLSLFKGSSTGVLTVKIPRDQVIYRNFWVRLTPEKIDDLVLVSKKCFWHPIYPSGSLEKEVYAQIYNKDLDSSCTDLSEPLDPEVARHILQEYISQSVSSETEFPISNGRGKVLTLPPGDYRYELLINRAPFAAPLSDKPPRHISEGTLRWQARRSYPIISKI